MDDLQAIQQALSVSKRGGTRSVTWFGRRICAVQDEDAPVRVAEVLYAQGYTLGYPAPIEDTAPALLDPQWREVLPDPRLSAQWSGWERRTPTTITRPGLPTITVGPHDIDIAADGSAVVTLPTLSMQAIPGWILVRHGDVARASHGVRIYLNTDIQRLRQALPDLVGMLLRHFDDFSAKFLATGHHQRRADSTVLYLPAVAVPELIDELELLAPTFVAGSAVPMFTSRITDGVATAPSPQDGSSYGMRMCRELAEAFLADPDRRGQGFELNALPAVNIDPIRGAATRAVRRELPLGARRTRDLTLVGTNGDPVQDLLRECRSLVATALTSGGQATWIGLRDDGTYRSLDAKTYDGLAGPLLMLAHAVALNPEPSTSRLLTAVATSILARQHELSVHGFHAGQAGTAAVLAEAAAISGAPRVHELAISSLERVVPAVTQAARDWDLVSGLSGSIIALTAAGNLLGRDVSQAVAMLGHRLAQMCETDASSGLVRWRYRSGRRSAALAGLAHGGTGAALALALAAGHERGAGDLIDRTLRFEDERRADARGWLDYRTVPLLEPATAWCHGAAGIGVGSALLDRARGEVLSAAIAPDPRHRDETSGHVAAATMRIRTALDRTRSSMTCGIDDGLCHGLSGQILCCLAMSAHLNTSCDRAHFADLLGTARQLPKSDLRMSKGRPGGILARLALAGLADPPLFITLLPGELLRQRAA